MTYHWLIPLLAAFANLALGLIVYRAKSATSQGRVFAQLSLLLVLWNLNFFILYFVSDAAAAFDMTRIFRMSANFVPVAILHLVISFRSTRPRSWYRFLVADYLIASMLGIATLLDLVVTKLHPFAWGYYSVSGPLYGAFTILVLMNFGAALTLAVHDYRTSTEPRAVVQVRFWLLGMLVALPLGLTNLLPTYGVPIYPLGSLGNVVWAGVVAYAIVRHRLLDIDVVVTKGVAYLTSALFVITPAFALTILMQERVFGSVHYDFSFALLVMFVAIGVLFPTLRLRTEAQVERAFFRGKHEYRSALASFAKSIIRILDSDKLVRELTDKLSETLRVDRVAVFMRDRNEVRYRLQYGIGILPAEDEYVGADPLIRTLAIAGDAVLREEAELSADSDWVSAGRALTANGWEVCVPLAASGSLIGFIGLGRKRDLEVFSVVDLDLLGTIAAQSAIGLENARLYEELHRSRDLIQRADRMSALGTLAAGVAHEIRNPLVSIQTFFQLAPSRLGDQEFFTSFLGLAENEVRRIADLVTELLTFARSPQSSVEEVDLEDVADRTVRLLMPQAHKYRVHLKRVGRCDLPIIRGEPDRIKQVLINVILNGLQATPENGIVTVRSNVVERGNRRFCQIEIHDTGPGIPADAREDIFNPFFTTKEKGTGLGLSIAHQIVAEHGGYITVDSREGHGCRFAIHFPTLGDAHIVHHEEMQRAAVSGE